MFKFLCITIALAIILEEVSGHGMMMDPINRSSRWRQDDSAPINWDDNQLYCGSFGVMWDQNGGKCGVCGDNYADPHPQENENTGRYGRGVIVKEYQSGDVIDIEIYLDTNHKGHFEYHLCQIADSSKPESGEECFKQLSFEDGSTEFKVKRSMKKIFNRVKLPEGVTCDHCVLRWHYWGGENWGICEDGTGGEGCGPQEVFRSCSDIRIV